MLQQDHTFNPDTQVDWRAECSAPKGNYWISGHTCFGTDASNHLCRTAKGAAELFVYGMGPTQIIIGVGAGPTTRNQFRSCLADHAYGSWSLVDCEIAPASHSDAVATSDVNWLQTAYAQTDELSIEQVGIIIDGLSSLLDRKSFDDVNDDLRNASPERMNADAIIAVAHISYAARDMLPSWHAFVEKSRQVLICRNDGEDLLEGLG
jgi:hypothetical protein